MVQSTCNLYESLVEIAGFPKRTTPKMFESFVASEPILAIELFNSQQQACRGSFSTVVGHEL